MDPANPKYNSETPNPQASVSSSLKKTFQPPVVRKTNNHSASLFEEDTTTSSAQHSVEQPEVKQGNQGPTAPFWKYTPTPDQAYQASVPTPAGVFDFSVTKSTAETTTSDVVEDEYQDLIRELNS